MYLKTEGVVLSRRNFGEADRIVTIYTKDFGKMSILAKGVRRPRSKKAGHLEIGNWCKFFIAKGKNLDILTEVELKHAFGINEFTEVKANKIYHLLELVKNLTPDNQRNPSVFLLLVRFLDKADSKSDFRLVASVFKVKLLSDLGFFSPHALKDSKTKDFIGILEEQDFEKIQSKFTLKDDSHLKLLAFLDSIIEDVSEQKLKTSRFLNGQI